MGNRLSKEMAELRQDMLEESRRETLDEIEKHNDVDYLLERTDINEAIEILERVSKILSDYGHELTIHDIISRF